MYMKSSFITEKGFKCLINYTCTCSYKAVDFHTGIGGTKFKFKSELVYAQ